MPKLRDVIRQADDIKPNAFSDATKTAWINEVEGFVQTEVLLLATEEIREYSWPEDEKTELLVAAPHSKVYWTYLTAMIDYANGEYDRYQNTMAMYNADMGEYMRWFALNYRPADTHEDVYQDDGTKINTAWRGYYLTAYGIAVKHGFQGTEAEWLASLKAEITIDDVPTSGSDNAVSSGGVYSEIGDVESELEALLEDET